MFVLGHAMRPKVNLERSSMDRSKPEQLRNCKEKLNRDAVIALIAGYWPHQNVVWSPSRVLYRLRITKTKKAPSDLRRRVRMLLETLEKEGFLMSKGTAVTNVRHHGIWSEPGFIRNPEHGS